MSGTPLHHKDKTRNQEVINFFGKILHVTRNKELVEKGYSSNPTITFIPGNTEIIMPGDYKGEYEYGVIRSKERNRAVWGITKKGVKKGPVVILIKYHKHIKYLMKRIPDSVLEKYKIESVHHKTEAKTRILNQFNKGKIDILIASMIIRRGMNLKLMRTLINAAGGDSHSNLLQLFGRGLRKEKGKKEEIDIWDFLDKGKYLQRHSTHRLRYYKQEDFPVKELK
jgi:superfamily II DNA or RNA helicase